MAGICKLQLANDMIRDIQVTKEPFDSERQQLSTDLSEMVASAEAEQAATRARLKELNDIITPLDAEMVDIHDIGTMRNKAKAIKLLESYNA